MTFSDLKGWPSAGGWGHEGHEGHEGHDQKERQHGREQGLQKDNLRVTWHLTLLSFFFKRHLSLKFHTDTHFLKIFWTSPQEKSEKFNIESWKSESYHGFFFIESWKSWTWKNGSVGLDKAAKQKTATRNLWVLGEFSEFFEVGFFSTLYTSFSVLRIPSSRRLVGCANVFYWISRRTKLAGD